MTLSTETLDLKKRYILVDHAKRKQKSHARLNESLTTHTFEYRFIHASVPLNVVFFNLVRLTTKTLNEFKSALFYPLDGNEIIFPN